MAHRRTVPSLYPAYRSRYRFTPTFRAVFSEFMYRTFPNTGRSGPQGLSYRPSTQEIPLQEFGSRPSSAYLLFSSTMMSKAARGLSLHCRIFFP